MNFKLFTVVFAYLNGAADVGGSNARKLWHDPLHSLTIPITQETYSSSNLEIIS